MAGKPLNIRDFRRMKEDGTPIVALTAYEAIFTEILDHAGVDLLLVGDSLGNVFQGRDTTIPVTLEHMIYHGEIVARVAKRAFVAVDMPFMSFQVNDDEAVKSAGRIMKETGCKAVKLEGGVTRITTIRRIVESGIPVIGHVGLTPQSVNAFGGYVVRGRENRQAIIDDARAVEDSGAFTVVLEKIPADLAAEITYNLTIPTIGIGAGASCDGQILVTQDILGMFTKFKPAFIRHYADLGVSVPESIGKFISDVRSGEYPTKDESYS